MFVALAGCQGQEAQPANEMPIAPSPIATSPSTPLPLTFQGHVRPTQVPYCKSFNETTYKVCDEFLSQWEAYGGLLRFGLPLSDWFYEIDDTSGEVHRVQYFERHVIKLARAKDDSITPGWSTARKIPLGQIIYDRKYPSGAPNQAPNKTGRAPGLVDVRNDIWLGGRFSDFMPDSPTMNFMDVIEWVGTPFTNEFIEKNEVDGKEYKVQYFEQAALEDHPENNPPDDVRFAPLGLYEFKHRYPNGIPSNPTPTPRPYVTPGPIRGCWRRNDLPPINPTPAVSLRQAEANTRAHYAHIMNGRKLGPLNYSKHVSVDITGAQSDIEIFRDAWFLSFHTDVPTPTPLPPDIPGDLYHMEWQMNAYSVYMDADTGQVLPGCEWGVISSP